LADKELLRPSIKTSRIVADNISKKQRIGRRKGGLSVRINQNNISSPGVHSYRHYANQEIQNGKTGKKRDQVEISAEAKELQQHPQWQIERENKVRQLKEQVQSGTYKIDAHAVAKSIYDYYARS
jgi:negative regulator of flagellin synthesis FlgM